MADGWEIRALVGPDGPSCYFAGVQTCGSVWLCPQCSAKIRARRSCDVRAAASAHVASGGRFLMVTLTMRHRAEHSLGELVDVLNDSWRSLQQDPRFRVARTELLGFIRATEVTQGLAEPGGSWHPHLHLLLFVRPGGLVDVPGLRSTRGHVSRLRGGQRCGCDGCVANHDGLLRHFGWMSDAWAERVDGRLGARPDSHGFHVKELDASAAEYVSKLADETARSDLKGSSRSVWAIVDAMEDGEAWAFRAWTEYQAMKGRSAVRWSRGLRDHFGLGRERSDEELAAEVEHGVVLERGDQRSLSSMFRRSWRGAPGAVARLELWEARLRRGYSTWTPPDDGFTELYEMLRAREPNPEQLVLSDV